MFRPRQIPIAKICINPRCQKTFETGDIRQKFCNRQCANRYYMRLRREINPEYMERVLQRSIRKPRNRYNRLCDIGKKKEIETTLTFEEYTALQAQPCIWCGEELTNKRGYEIDRLFNNHGYTVKNSVPCCTRCNRSKGKLSPAEFLTMVKKIALNQRLFT